MVFPMRPATPYCVHGRMECETCRKDAEVSDAMGNLISRETGDVLVETLRNYREGWDRAAAERDEARAEVARLTRERDDVQTLFTREQEISEDAIRRLQMWRGGGVTLESEGFRVADRIYDNPCLAEDDAIEANKGQS